MIVKTRTARTLVAAAASLGTVIGISFVAFGDESSQEPVPAYLSVTDKDFPTNQFGLTVGQPTVGDIDARHLPDLMPTTTSDGRPGFIRTNELYFPEPKTPEEAAAQTRKLENEQGEVWSTVYEADGKTVLGRHLVATGSIDEK